jgi:hypothetical protein
MTEFEWEKIGRLFDMHLTSEQKAAGCPDCFTPRQLSIMQRPTVQKATDRNEIVTEQRALLKLIEAACASGALSSVERSRTVETTKTVQVEDHNSLRRNWVTQRPLLISKVVKTGERTEIFIAIERIAFRDWLALRGEDPSEHISAWLRPLAQTKVEQGGSERDEVTPAESDKLTIMKLAAVIEQLGRRYPSLQGDMDRPEDWAKDCRTERRGFYYLEKVEAGCRAKWGNQDAALPSPAALKMLGQVHKIQR